MLAQWVPSGLPAPAPNQSYSQLWHLSPVQPVRQRQWPVCRSQRPPLRHLQLCWQPAPKWPGRHSAGGEEDGVPLPRSMSQDPGDPASCTQSLGSRVLRKDGEGAGHSAGLKPHPRMLFTPPPNQGATSDHRGRGLDRGPLACQPCLTQNPRGLLSALRAQCSPFSQARPVQPSGQVQWPETGSQEPPCWQRQEC